MRKTLLLSAVLALCLAAGANADDHGEKAENKARELATIRTAVERGELMPLPRVLQLAQAQVPGDVVKTELEAKNERLVYEVKILTSTGRVREVKLDAKTGAIVNIEDD
jgi:uncharacterized membrane protein YkoI